MADVDLITKKPVSGHAWAQANAPATNYFFPSVGGVSESLTIPVGEHILWMEGAGSVSSSYGTATEAVPLIFTGTNTTVTFTVTNADIVQINTGNTKSPYIPTTIAASSITETKYTFPASNINTSNAEINIEIYYEGDDTDIITIGAVDLLKAGDVNGGAQKGLILSDGTNTIEQAIDLLDNPISITLTATQMSLTANGQTQTVAYTPIASGLITVSETFYNFTIK